MNEPKRRGRPPKAKVEEFLAQPVEVKDIGGGVKMLVTPVADIMRAGALAAEYERAQAYARRVWNGQSTDVPRNERLRRVAKALEGQGLSMEGVEL